MLRTVHLVVDNTAGGDAQFAEEVARGLSEHDIPVELRRPTRATMFDTSVNLVTAGLTIRVSERPDRGMLEVIEGVVRAALRHRPSLRRQTRSVPVRMTDSERVIEWIDVFE